MKRNDKMSMLAELLKKGNNRFTVEELVEAAGSERDFICDQLLGGK